MENAFWLTFGFSVLCAVIAWGLRRYKMPWSTKQILLATKPSHRRGWILAVLVLTVKLSTFVLILLGMIDLGVATVVGTCLFAGYLTAAAFGIARGKAAQRIRENYRLNGWFGRLCEIGANLNAVAAIVIAWRLGVFPRPRQLRMDPMQVGFLLLAALCIAIPQIWQLSMQKNGNRRHLALVEKMARIAFFVFLTLSAWRFLAIH